MRAAIAVAVLLVCAAASSDEGCHTMRSLRDIETDAAGFALKMDGKAPRGVECVNIDSDDDGYVTCTVFRVDRDPYSIQCAARAGWEGCKPTIVKPVVNVGQ